MQSAVPVLWPRAKIEPPRPRALLERPRLLERLNAAVRNGQVTLVVAPGGSGKTSLLASWAGQSPVPVAWYALDTADRDMRRLAAGLCAAIDRAVPGTGRQALAALENGASEAVAIGLLLGAAEGQPLALVVDDFHHLDDVPEATALWDHFLRFRPPSLSLIILSRSVPLLGFAALAAFDDLMGLGREDLSFDALEAPDLLAAHGLDAQYAAQFAERTGGWATGLLLLARAGPGGVRFLRARTEALMEYLGREILDALPGDIRAFLLESAALGPVTAEEADAILERHDSAALYADIAARGLFLEENNGVYRYHDLFTEYLVGVFKTQQPGPLRALRRHAARWWAAHDDLPRALSILADDEDWEELAAMLDRERTSLAMRGLWGTTIAHVERLPAQYRNARLLALCGQVRAQRGEHAEAVALADAGMAAATNEEEWLEPALVRAYALFQAGREKEAVLSVEATLDIARRVGNSRMLTRLLECRGLARLQIGCLDGGRQDLLTALSDYEREHDEYGQARTYFNLSTQLITAGHVRDAEGYLVLADGLWRRIDNAAFLGNVHNSRALLHLLTGDLVQARIEAQQAIALARETGYPILECQAMETLAEVYADEGHADEAERHACAAVDMAHRLDVPPVLNDALRTRIAAVLLRRDRAEARRLLDEAHPLAATEIDHALLDLLEGMLALRSRAYKRATEILEPTAEQLEALSRPHRAARALLLCAEALLASGHTRRAEDTLNRMAALVLPLGCEGSLRALSRYVRQVLEERRMLRRLRRETRLLLDRLASDTPSLTVLTPTDDAGAAQEIPALHLSPFGQGCIRVAGREIEHCVLPPKAREVLFYASAAGRPVRRDELLDAVWEGDMGAAQALWDASRHLRRVLGEESWVVRGRAYTLTMPAQDDGRLFDECAALVRQDAPLLQRLDAAERALDLIGDGGYLEWCDSLWVATERARVARSAMDVALALADIYDELRRRNDAIEACRRAVTFEPFDEAPRLALIRRLIATDQASAARYEYDTYRHFLYDELGVEPSAALQALFKSR